MRCSSRLLATLLLCSLLPLGGCSNAAFDRLRIQSGFDNVQSTVVAGQTVLASIYTARPLALKYTIHGHTGQVGPGEVQAGSYSEFLGAAVIDSMNSCNNFVVALTAGQASLNTAADVTSIVLSGLATVFTPVATVRALAAASTLVQGSQAAVNAEFFQQLTLVIFVQQINDNYFTKLAAFRRTWLAPNQAVSNLYGALAELEEIHRECSIPTVAARIGKTADRPALPRIITGEDLAAGVYRNGASTGFRKVVAVANGAATTWQIFVSTRDGTTSGAPIFSSRDTRKVAQQLNLTGYTVLAE